MEIQLHFVERPWMYKSDTYNYPSLQDKYKETDGKQLSYELLKMEMRSMTITD